jgi:hypothetical protein
MRWLVGGLPCLGQAFASVRVVLRMLPVGVADVFRIRSLLVPCAGASHSPQHVARLALSVCVCSWCRGGAAEAIWVGVRALGSLYSPSRQCRPCTRQDLQVVAEHRWLPLAASIAAFVRVCSAAGAGCMLSVVCIEAAFFGFRALVGVCFGGEQQGICWREGYGGSFLACDGFRVLHACV